MTEGKQEKLTGTVSAIIFFNEDNGYTVADIETREKSFVAVGTMFGISEGEKVELTGFWTEHPSYGEQFKVETYEKKLPESRDEIFRYLSSGIIKGVRKATAEKIISKFGEDALKVISSFPEKLSEIKGISEKKANDISNSFNMQLGTSELFMFLQKYGISANACMKIYRTYRMSSKSVITENPYVLCEGDYGISFKKADEIAMQNGIDAENDKRICAAIVYMLRYSLQFGHTYLPENILISNSASLLGISSSKLGTYVDYLCSMLTLVREKKKEHNAIYLYDYYSREKYVASKIALLASSRYETNDINIEAFIKNAEDRSSLKFASLQHEAVRLAVFESVLVITGGPGTGKTTIINAIIDVMKSMNLKVALTAPTGRAAKRMTELCHIEAKTIHRLLEVSFSDDDEIKCLKNEEEPIDADVIIVDEMSMVDISLMDKLLRATRRGTRLILVGDVNQLPSVGAGNVLKDIINSGTVNVICLKDIFRQSDDSTIVTNAHAINEGKYPICNKKDSDFFFASIQTPERGVDYICELCTTRLKKAYGYNPFDIQVLSPVKKGLTGVNNLNSVLQNLINPPSKNKKERKQGDIVFREGDKVMQTKNNYDLEWTDTTQNFLGSGIFNGDVGYIEKINPDFQTATVVFDDKRAQYSFKDLAELSLAYAITVHKSQGNEFPVVIMPMFRAPEMLLSRNLLYTGVTRAKSLVILVGNGYVLEKMIDNNREENRYSGLMEKLVNENNKF